MWAGSGAGNPDPPLPPGQEQHPGSGWSGEITFLPTLSPFQFVYPEGHGPVVRRGA